MRRYTRKQMAEDLVQELLSERQHRALQLASLLLPEVSEILRQRENFVESERLAIEQEAYALQSEPEPPYTKR